MAVGSHDERRVVLRMSERAFSPGNLHRRSQRASHEGIDILTHEGRIQEHRAIK
jgi:hypothetical protein